METAITSMITFSIRVASVMVTLSGTQTGTIDLVFIKKGVNNTNSGNG